MALREYRMKFEKVGEGEQSVVPKELSLRSKLGGNPNWDQSDETPICDSCNKSMTFIAQIDSIEHDSKVNPHRVNSLSDEQQYMFGDVGMIYLFFCIDCLESKSVFQCG